MASLRSIDTPRAFCEAVLAELVLLQRRNIPLGDPLVERAFARIVGKLRDRVREAVDTHDDELKREISAVVSGLSPDPNQGTFDQFWSTFRKLQPAFLSVPNPFYPDMKIGLSEADAEETRASIDPKWSTIVEESAEILSRAL